MTVTMFPFFHSKEYPIASFFQLTHAQQYSSLFCVHAEFIGKLLSPTKAWPLSSLVNAKSVKWQNTVFIQHYNLFVLGRSIWAYNCTDKHFWMFMPHTREHYKPSLSLKCHVTLLLHLSKWPWPVSWYSGWFSATMSDRGTRFLNSTLL